MAFLGELLKKVNRVGVVEVKNRNENYEDKLICTESDIQLREIEIRENGRIVRRIVPVMKKTENKS